MGQPFAQGRLTRVLAIAAATTLTIGAIAPAAASDPPARSVKAPAKTAGSGKQTRYCVKRNQAGAGATEKHCKVRARWIRENHFDPALAR